MTNYRAEISLPGGPIICRIKAGTPLAALRWIRQHMPRAGLVVITR